MEMRGGGGNFRGTAEIGNYYYDIYTYAGRYIDPATGDKVQFLNPDSVIVRYSKGRLDATFGDIPNIGVLLGMQNMNIIPEMPGRISMSGSGMDFHTNVWVSPDGEQLFGGVGTRPLMIPTAIDTFGCLDTSGP